jgi:hypothetical protein
MDTHQTIRAYLKDILFWQEAHLNFESAVSDLPKEYRGKKPDGFPYSIWQLVEHIRIAQWDIVDFTRNPDYKEISWLIVRSLFSFLMTRISIYSSLLNMAPDRYCSGRQSSSPIIPLTMSGKFY